MARKPKPAPIYDKNKKKYRLHFCYNGKQYRRHYIRNQNTAYTLQNEINHLINQFKYGLIIIPPGYTLSDFIFGTVVNKPDPQNPSQEAITRFSSLIQKYNHLSMPPSKAQSSYNTEQQHIRHLQRFLAQRQSSDPCLEDINVGFFDEYKKFRYSQGIKTDTVKKELGTFQNIFRTAVDHGYLPYNVVRDVKRDKSQNSGDRFHTHSEIQEMITNGHYSDQEIKELRRYRYLTYEEIEKLIKLAESRWIHPILITFADTGMRRGEVIDLEWADVNLKDGIMWIKSRKQSQARQKTTRQIPISNRLLPILKKQKTKTQNYRWVFISPNQTQLTGGCLRETFRRIIKGTEFEGLGFHVFRHSLASNLAAAGEDQRVIDHILGHQTKSMRQRYQHLFPSNIRFAVNRWHQEKGE